MGRSPLLAFLAASSLLLSACGAEDTIEDEELGVCEGRIINGQKDYTHQAVVAVLSYSSACSGTSLRRT